MLLNLANQEAEDRDRTKLAIFCGTATLSVIAVTIAFYHKAILLYGDTLSHMEIARRADSMLATSPINAPGQLGAVWLPLPHVLMLPLVWDNTLYQNGLAGSIVSMVAFVATVILVYGIGYQLTGQKLAGVVSAAVFGLNANMLYMQSTPMTESLLFCLLAAMTFFVLKWADTDKVIYLVYGALAALLATLTRYESWVVLLCLSGSVVCIAWTKRQGLSKKLHRRRVLDRIIVGGFIGFAGIIFWLCWNLIFFGNPLYFQTGPYAKPALWLSSHEPAIGHLLVAFKTYWYAVKDNVGWPILLLAAAGLIALIAVEWWKNHNVTRTLPVLSLLVIFPFFVYSIYKGERPLHITPLEADLYNVRFGLIMLLPAAILVGYLVGALQRHPAIMNMASGLVLVSVIGVSAIMFSQSGPITYREARGSQSPVEAQVADAFQKYYTGGMVLMQSFGNEGIAFKIPVTALIYEGSYQKWGPALRSPSTSHITWIVDRCGSDPDLVCTTVNQGEFARYNKVWQTSDGTYRIYRLDSNRRQI